jgi:hypothetical protein
VTIYPNDEARIVVYPEKYPKSLKEMCDTSSDDLVIASKSANHSLPVEGSDSISSALSSAFSVKSKVDTGRRKLKLFLSRNGRRTLQRCGACFDDSEMTERLMLTGTLPGRLKEAHQALAEYSTYASKTLTNWLTRRHPGCKWLYAWEFQERGALHIHLVAELPLGVSAYVQEHFRDEWNRILTAISVRSGVNLRKRTQKYTHKEGLHEAHSLVLRHSPGRYLSKYISKEKTNGFGGWRFPPRQWYQASRSILKELREKTQIFERESLSFRQAKTFIEHCSHVIASGVQSGSRLFTGSVLAWSAYLYRDGIDVSEFDSKMISREDRTLPIAIIAKTAIATLKQYPQTRAWCRQLTVTQMETIMRMETASDTEMLLIIESAMSSLTITFERLSNKTKAANFLNQSANWWLNRFGYEKYTPTFRDELLRFVSSP